MAEKLKPCCAKIQSQLTGERGNLAALARKAATRAGRGLDITRLKALIDASKVQIASYEQAQIDHEAGHASDYDRMADTLQAAGPDEFPRGYYEHLAREPRSFA